MEMSINIYNIKKWTRMLSGKSVEHVNQDVGKIYSSSHVKGYYNDLTEKVLNNVHFNHEGLPILKVNDGSEILFPISIFQYGLGAYDMFLLENKRGFLEEFSKCVTWALNNQGEDGEWSNFFYDQPDSPYSSMAQGEGVSLLIRAYKQFNDEKYFLAAEKAINFLITPIDKGGTTEYVGNGVFMKEFTNKPTVLNGWIFSLFGIYDYIKISNDKNVNDVFNMSLKSLADNLEKFDNGYWSMYDMDGMITSPFYHDLHIAQLKVLYDLFGIVEFQKYAEKWSGYKAKRFNRNKAFIVKVFQKIVEK